MARDTVEWLRDNDYYLRNLADEPTYFGHNNSVRSTIDLTFTNRVAEERDVVREWLPDPFWSCTSDHAAIRWIVDQGATPVDTNSQLRFNFKKADIPLFKQVFAREIRASPKIFEHLSLTASEEVIEEAAAKRFTECLETATTEAVPVRKWSSRTKPWWNAETEASHDHFVSLDEESKEQFKLHRRVDFDLLKRVDDAKKAFHCTVKTAKQQWVNQTLEEVEPAKVFKFRNLQRGRTTAGCRPSSEVRPNDGSTST